MFGSYDRIGRNVGILITWNAVLIGNGIRKCWRVRRRLREQQQKNCGAIGGTDEPAAAESGAAKPGSSVGMVH